MRNYNLGFISDELIFNHVKATMLQYSRKIDLKVIQQEYNRSYKADFRFENLWPNHRRGYNSRMYAPD